MAGLNATAAPGQGFADPVSDSQTAFRSILAAMSEPGRIYHLIAPAEAPPSIASATASVLLALADYETPIWLSPALGDDVSAYLRFHCGAPIVKTPDAAAFAIMTGKAQEPDLASFHAGDPLYPDRSATVIVECQSFAGGMELSLAGPGIETTRRITPAGLPADFVRQLADNAARYPLGVDVVVTCGADAMALPRTTQATASGIGRE